MVLSAEDFQKMLEGAPDPFPSQNDTASKPAASTSGNAPLDTESETLFPSLGNNNVNPSTSKAGAGHPVKAARAVKPVSTPVFTDSFVLAGIDATAKLTRDGKPKTLGEIVKDVSARFKVKVELFSQKTSNQTTFTVTGASDSSVEQARKALTRDLSPTITLTMQAPASLVGSIVGAKGANLKRIRDQTSTKIDLPPRDKLAVPNANGHDSSSRSTSPFPASPMEDAEATIPITITGPASMAHQARELIQEIITERTSQSSQKVKVTPAHVYPFVLSRRGDFLKVAAAYNAEVDLARDDAAREITVSGDREAVGKVADSIRSCMAFYEGDLTMVKISLPKRQHRLFNHLSMDAIFQKSKCSVVVPPANDPSEDVQVWGKAANLGQGLQAVMERANSRHTHSIKIPGSVPHHALQHIQNTGYDLTFNNAHPEVEVYFPPAVPGAVNVDFIGERAAVDKAHKELAAYFALLQNATREIQIDYLIHSLLNAKASKQLKGYQASKNILVYFPSEAETSSSVLLVYDPEAKQPAKNKQAVLTEVEKEIMELVGTLGQIKTETVSVEKRWHEAVTGKNNSTLNALIGEGRALAIEVGGTGHEDIVVIRGSPADVDRATKDILRIVEEAKNDAIDSGYVTEFSILQQYVPRIVGSAGANIQKYREQLDVKIDIDDARDAGDQTAGKKKKAATSSSQSVIRITGRKHNAEEAKKRILAQVDKLADETSETLKIPRQYHSAIIGAQGKYIQRLQDKYGVKINMARENDASPDEVQIRGGKKGVSLAKNEIQELVEYEKENSNTVVVQVSIRAIPRILGAKGAKIHEIMAETGAHIDVSDKDKRDEAAGTAPITIKGTKKAVAAAKTAITAIAKEVDDETTVTVHVESKFHRTIIGGGGVGLKNLLARVGAPSDPKEQAGLVKFPQGGEEVIIRGERTLVKKIQAELERVVAGLRERVVVGVVIPHQQHRMLIGHGGAPLMELEKKTGAEVQFPGSRSYNQVAPPENAGELEEADPKDVVKVVGPRPACEKAISELLDAVAKAPNKERREQNRDRAGGAGPTTTVQIPFKHHHLLRQNGNLFRDLRAVGVNFSQDGKPPHENSGAAGRIDDEVETDSHGVEWKLVPYGVGTEEGATELTLKARDEQSLELAQKVIREALEKADGITHIGYMTFPDRGAFPRIIGNKGSVIDSLSVESGAEIIVPRDDVTVKIYGNNDAVNRAKASITRVAFGGRGRRNED